ncbi:MAG: hypothetical protein U0935_06350 [Pirellulales bacterium]
MLLCAAVVSVGSGEARAENYLQKRLRNTPFDPTTPLRILPRSQPSTSRLGVDEHVYSHYRIDGNGWVWVSQHAAGGPENWQPNGQRASIQHDADGRAFYHFPNSTNRPRAPQHDVPGPASTSAPPRLKAYQWEAARGGHFVYEQTGGPASFLNVFWGPQTIHVATYIADAQYQGRDYCRYRVVVSADSAPAWVHGATRERRYEIWFPRSGQGMVYYSKDLGRSFVPESEVPPAGFVSRQP